MWPAPAQLTNRFMTGIPKRKCGLEEVCVSNVRGPPIDALCGYPRQSHSLIRRVIGQPTVQMYNSHSTLKTAHQAYCGATEIETVAVAVKASVKSVESTSEMRMFSFRALAQPGAVDASNPNALLLS